MEHIRKNVLADSNWRVQKCCCCCCEVKTATTVIGLITIISAIAEMSLPDLETPEEAATDEDSVVKAIRGRTIAAYVIECMINTMSIALSGALIYGNFKSNTKWMIPYVYVLLIVILIRILFDTTAILSYLILGNFREGLPLLFFGVLTYSLSLYLWHVVRCRTLEIDEIDQPTGGVIFMQRDPELPAYGDVQGTGGTVQGSYGGVQATYGTAPGAYGDMKGAYENVQGTHGNVQGTFGNVQGAYGNVQGAYANVQGSYGTAQGTHGNVQGSYGNAQGAYENVQSINEKPQGEPPAYVNDRIN